MEVPGLKQELLILLVQVNIKQEVKDPLKQHSLKIAIVAFIEFLFVRLAQLVELIVH